MKCTICSQNGHNKRTCPLGTSTVKQLMAHLSDIVIKHDEILMKQPNLKSAHIYCVLNKISPQQYGPWLERYILTNFGFTKNSASSQTGDGSKAGKNVEIKVSLGGSTHTKFNFVQLRPAQMCDYILTAYHLGVENVENEGDLYVFKVSAAQMKSLICLYGRYAHGNHGEINMDNLTHEYAIRTTVGDLCWRALLQFKENI